MIRKHLILLCLIVLQALAFAAPSLSLAAVNTRNPGQIVPIKCNQPSTDGRAACGWDELIELGQNIMQFCIYLMAMAAVISLIRAGWIFMSQGNTPGARTKAKDILWKVTLGVFLTLGAWVLVTQMLRWLGVDNSYSLLG